VTLRQQRPGRYTVELDGVERGEVVRSSWTGRWLAFTVTGTPVGVNYATRDEAAERLIQGWGTWGDRRL
jgi:hypothetical protein